VVEILLMQCVWMVIVLQLPDIIIVVVILVTDPPEVVILVEVPEQVVHLVMNRCVSVRNGKPDVDADIKIHIVI
jgi:hypothetical protein